VQVVEFFPELLFTPHIEVIKAPLPKRRRFVDIGREGKGQLSGRGDSVSAQRARNFLLQNLQDLGGISLRWFTDKQMHVFGHDHVPDQSKCVLQANLIQNSHEAISRAHGSQIRMSPVTAEGDKMEIAASVKSFQGMADDFHGTREKSKSALLKTQGCRTHTPFRREVVAE